MVVHIFPKFWVVTGSNNLHRAFEICSSGYELSIQIVTVGISGDEFQKERRCMYRSTMTTPQLHPVK